MSSCSRSSASSSSDADASISSRTTSLRRRRRTSRSTSSRCVRPPSSSSSSSASRASRMTADSRIAWPGNSCGRCDADDVFEQHERRGRRRLATCDEPRQTGRHLHDREPRRSRLAGAASSRSARFRLSDDSSGNGRDTSMASGVSTGSTASRKNAPSAARRARQICDTSDDAGCRATPAPAAARR